MADETLYRETINPVDNMDPMTDKKVFYVLDQNGGAYNGSILLDTSVLASSGGWCAYSESILEVPFVVSLQSIQTGGAVDISAAYNAFTLGLKNGYHQIIDSIQVDYNNTNVVQLQPFTNFFVNWKCMSSWSQADLDKWSSTTGVFPDSAGAYSFSNAAAAGGGDGYSNVADVSAIGTYTSPRLVNEGFLERRRRTTAFDNSYNGIPTMSDAIAANLAKNTVVTNGAGAAQIISWVVMAQIRLKDLSDFFDKLPLVKGAFLRMTINYNSAISRINCPAAGTRSLTSTTMNSGRTNPMLLGFGGSAVLAPNLAANTAVAGSANALNAAITTGANNPDKFYNIACGVAGNALISGANVNLPLRNCRLYVPCYQLDPLRERELISLKKEREVSYLDIYNYNVSNVTANQTFTQILTNGIVNPKYVVVMPFANSSVAGSVFLAAGGVTNPVYQSPFDTAPGTTSPMAALTNFNVQVSGMNILQQSAQYDFDVFYNEVSQINAINGGITTGLTSGLLNQFNWDNAYRYYAVDLSRRIPSENDVAKSVVITGQNATPVALDLVCFIAFERKIRIDMATGALLQ